MKRKAFKYGGMSVTVTVLFIAGVVLLNMLVGLLADRFYLKVDLTAGRLFDIGEDTAWILRDLDEPITITVLAKEADYQNYSDSMIIREILQKYAAMSDGNVTVRYTDPTLNPALAQQYSLATLKTGDILVESSRRYTAISWGDLFDTAANYDTGYSEPTAVKAEQKLTNAILYVLNEVATKAVIITGHDEYRSQTFEAFLKDSNYQVEEVDLTTEDIPGDATLAVISVPAGDYTGDEINKLDGFLASGGNVIWLDSEEGQHRPNLKSYFEEWGVSFETSVIFEPELSDPQYPYVIYPKIAEHDATALVDQSSSMRFFAPIVNPISRLYESKGDRTTVALLTTSVQSFARPYESTAMSYEKDAGDVSGPFDVAVLSSETTYDDDGGTRSRSVLAMGVGPVDYLDNTNLNSKFFSSVLKYMSPSAEIVNIPARDMTPGSIQILAGQRTVIFWVLMAIPLIIMGLGIVVWRKRRHL